MPLFDRQITQGFNPKEAKVDLLVKKSIKFDGKEYSEGDTMRVTKSEAKRILTVQKEHFTISA